MSWNLLKTNYRDATWTGQKKYILSENEDGTYSIEDVTEYQNYDQSLFGASDANAINSAINAIRLAMDDDTMLPKATPTLLGGIKVGNYLTVGDDGTLSINVNALAIALKGGTASTGSGSSGTGSNTGSNTGNNSGSLYGYHPYTYGSGGDIGALVRVINNGKTSQTFYINLADGMNVVSFTLITYTDASLRLTHANVDWGDGTTEEIHHSSPMTNQGFSHFYSSGGTKCIQLTNVSTTNEAKTKRFTVGLGVINCDGFTPKTSYDFKWKIISQLFNPHITYLNTIGCSGMSVYTHPEGGIDTGGKVVVGAGSQNVTLCSTSSMVGPYLTECRSIPENFEYMILSVDPENALVQDDS